MVVTSTSTGDYILGTSAGTNANDIVWGSATGTSANFGIPPRVAVKKPLYHPKYDNVPRRHKDKNGCVKKSYWETQPINIQDLSGLGFGTAVDSYTISTSGVANMTMGDTDDSANVCLSSASA